MRRYSTGHAIRLLHEPCGILHFQYIANQQSLLNWPYLRRTSAATDSAHTRNLLTIAIWQHGVKAFVVNFLPVNA
jgi:hypothetical protein